MTRCLGSVRHLYSTLVDLCASRSGLCHSNERFRVRNRMGVGRYASRCAGLAPSAREPHQKPVDRALHSIPMRLCWWRCLDDHCPLGLEPSPFLPLYSAQASHCHIKHTTTLAFRRHRHIAAFAVWVRKSADMPAPLAKGEYDSFSTYACRGRDPNGLDMLPLLSPLHTCYFLCQPACRPGLSHCICAYTPPHRPNHASQQALLSPRQYS